MAQLGDTTVIGDIFATGRIIGEGNRIYVPDYNAFDPTELSLQVGEMATIYNNIFDTTKSHAPWADTSAGYVIKNNAEEKTSNNCVYTIVIHRSNSSGDFATRVWQNKKWNSWITGGGSIKAYSGTSAPSSTLGNDGDIYILTS